MQTAPRRIGSLDALRGVAAAAVVVCHFFTAIGNYGFNPAPSMLYVLTGRLPVAIFFALSGYVLALPFFTGSAATPIGFLIKRVLRIYTPYLAVAAFSAIARDVVSPPILWGTLLMTGTDTGIALNPPFWSLVIEMRYSILFPILVALVARAPGVSGVLALLTAVAAAIVMPAVSAQPHQPTTGFTFASSFVVTAYYAPLFIGGILLALYRDEVLPFVRAHAGRLWIAVAALVVLGYFVDLAFVLAPVAIVALVPETPAVVNLFKARAIVWLGRVSYSLYLVHGVVLLTIWRDTGSGIVAAALFIPVSLVLAELSYRFFEVPSIRLGSVLAGQFRPIASTAAKSS